MHKLSLCAAMNAVAVTTVLILALSVGVAHCDIQQQQDPLRQQQQDEDLFFPESLLVDPAKSTNTADDYSSLEAPKEDNDKGLKSPKEDTNIIAKSRPSKGTISLSNLVKPQSTKNHLDHSYFDSQESVSREEDSSDTSKEEDDDSDSEEGSATYEGSGRPHFNWDIEGSGDDYGSGEVDGSGDYDVVGQEYYENSIEFLAEADLEEFIPIRTGNTSITKDSHIDVDFNEEEEDVKINTSPKNNLVIQGYGGSSIGEMAKIDFLENEMHQVKGQVSQLSARMEQQSNDISHLQRIILQLQQQINTLIYIQSRIED